VQQLGAQDVPLLGAIKKLQKYLDNLVGDLTEKVMARSGNILYINNVAKLIAKVCPVFLYVIATLTL
jgi:hypothetical protein